nr:hypothetical protein [Tanacetum cinerariifolium]
IKNSDAYNFKMEKKKFRVDTKVFREILQICPRILNQDFLAPPSEEELVTFIQELGYSGRLMYQADNRKISLARKEHMPYPRFTKAIINHVISKDKTISMRNRIKFYTIHEDSLLGKQKDFHISQVSGSGDGTNFESWVPDEKQPKTFGTDKGTDGILRTVTESSLRRNLKLKDEDRISSLPDTELFENLTLMGYNIYPNQKFTFQKGQFPHQLKYLIHTIMQCLSLKSTGFSEFSSNISTALGEGSDTPTEPHHTPSPVAQPPSHTTHSSSTLPPITTTSIPTITPSETTLIGQYTRRARIA